MNENTHIKHQSCLLLLFSLLIGWLLFFNASSFALADEIKQQSNERTIESTTQSSVQPSSTTQQYSKPATKKPAKNQGYSQTGTAGNIALAFFGIAIIGGCVYYFVKRKK